MAAYCLENGKVREACGGYASREYAGIYHMSANGEFRREEHIPVLKPGEGLLAHSEGFYVEPLEIQVDFLKASGAKRWLEYLALRHIDRVRYLDENLWVLAEIREEEV